MQTDHTFTMPDYALAATHKLTNTLFYREITPSAVELANSVHTNDENRQYFLSMAPLIARESGALMYSLGCVGPSHSFLEVELNYDTGKFPFCVHLISFYLTLQYLACHFWGFLSRCFLIKLIASKTCMIR